MNKIIWKANLAIFFAELFNALNVNAQKYLLPQWSSPFAMLFLRVLFGLVLFWIIALFQRKQKIVKKDFAIIMGGGAISLTSYITFYLLGVMKSSPVDSSLIMSIMPVVVLVLAILFFNEKLSKLKLLGILLGIAGTCLIILVQTGKGGENTLMGNIFCLFSAISYGLYLIVNKLVASKYSPVTILKWMFLGAFILSIPLTFIFGFELPLLHPISWRPFSVLIFVLIFPTGLTYFLIPYALKRLQASTVAMYDYQVPIVASFLGIMLGQASFSWYQPISTILIFSGVFLVSHENKKFVSKKE